MINTSLFKECDKNVGKLIIIIIIFNIYIAQINIQERHVLLSERSQVQTPAEPNAQGLEITEKKAGVLRLYSNDNHLHMVGLSSLLG